jgi:glycosyltransferase involved in cell wall biosynthesis
MSAEWTAADEPVVSIVLGTLDRLPLLRKSIECVRAQYINVPFEIIVIDGGSTDGTAAWLSSQQDIITIVHHNRMNQKRLRSWGWFMNLGFKVAHGELVLMISDDALLLPGSVNNALSFIKRERQSGRKLGGIAFYYRDWPIEEKYAVQHTIGGMLMVNHGIFTREALEAVGYCEERAYSFYKADSDLALKIWHAGYEIVACDGAYLEHLLPADEELRNFNNKTLARDRTVLHERWKGIYSHTVRSKMFGQPWREYTEYEDLSHTVDMLKEFVPTPTGDQAPI